MNNDDFNSKTVNNNRYRMNRTSYSYSQSCSYFASDHHRRNVQDLEQGHHCVEVVAMDMAATI